MAWKGLGEFLAALEERGELHRVTARVDPDQEIAEITHRVSKSLHGGKGILFTSVRGSDFPLVTNIFGSPRRMALALGVDSLDDLSLLMAEILEKGAQYPAPPLMLVSDPPCREVVESSPDLLTLPLLCGWPGDGSVSGGGYLTLPLVCTADPVTGAMNCGIYRVQVIASDQAVVGWHPGSDGQRQYEQYQSLQRRMPVAIVLGGPPELLFAGSFSLPGLPDEFSFAGMLRNEPVEVTRCLTSNLLIPASAEVVIEGYLDPGETALEGPFGNHTGFYAPARSVPLFRVTALTRRRNPVIPATVVGPPPQEDCWLAKAAERLMLPWLQRCHPGIVDISMPLETIFHRGVLVSVESELCGSVPELIRRLWESGPLRRARIMIVVDADSGVDPAGAWWRMLNCCQWERDLLVSEDGSCLALDATRKPEQGSSLERGETVDLVSRRWKEYGL
jgi:4-hydroxy-3-polyprenylbenzoate decarboxylase